MNRSYLQIVQLGSADKLDHISSDFPLLLRGEWNQLISGLQGSLCYITYTAAADSDYADLMMPMSVLKKTSMSGTTRTRS